MSYGFKSAVRYSELAEDHLLSVPSLMDYFQDCVTFQSESIGQGLEVIEKRQRAWVMSFWQVVVRRRPKLGEEIETITIPYQFRGFFGLRNFVMLDSRGERLAWANSYWTNLNMQTGFPERLTEEDMAGYELEERLDMDYASRKIPLPSGWGIREPVTIRRHYLDTHSHVNNCQYVRMAMDYLPEGFNVHELRAEYKKQAVSGDVFYPLVSEEEGRIVVAFNSVESVERVEPYAVMAFS